LCNGDCATTQRDRVITDLAEHYVALGQRLRDEELPYGTQWRAPEAWRDKLVANKEYQVGQCNADVIICVSA
jgi:hypothetical protein